MWFVVLLFDIVSILFDYSFGARWNKFMIDWKYSYLVDTVFLLDWELDFRFLFEFHILWKCLVEHLPGVDTWGRDIAKDIPLAVMILRMMLVQGHQLLWHPHFRELGHGLKLWKIYFGLLLRFLLFTMVIGTPTSFTFFCMMIGLGGNRFFQARSYICLMLCQCLFFIGYNYMNWIIHV